MVVGRADLHHQRPQRRPESGRGRFQPSRIRAAPRGRLLLLQQLVQSSHHLQLGCRKQIPSVVCGQPVRILLQKPLARVAHVARKVTNAEHDRASKLRHDESRVARASLEHLRDEGHVGGFGDRDLLVQKIEHAAPSVEQRDAVGVIGVIYGLFETDTLFLAVLDLCLEHVVVELVLQVLVAKIDEELLQRVALETFEATNVQNAEQTV
mmetsp:Transcript_225/g.494  ORF Transcript_225/g.494 Transcript_225/m.494 type:complete len:209 (-) Transcript_225:1239-1865(-)